jgi:hypothetical protein
MRTEHRDDMLSDVCHRASLPSNAAPCMLGSLTLATCRCRAATEIYLLTYCNHCALGALSSLRTQCSVLCQISALSAQCIRVL